MLKLETVAGAVRTARPRQWSKNLLVFAAPGAAGVLFQPGIFFSALWAFAIFCLASAGTYFVNDANDVLIDRQHPTKKYRPVASGVISVKSAFVIGLLLVASSVAAAFLMKWQFGLIITIYLSVTSIYSFGLKNVEVIEIFAVATGFVLRAIAGVVVTGVALSEWFLLVASAGALMVIAAKREAEKKRSMVDAATKVRVAVSGYTESFLGSLRNVAAAIVLISYCLWSFELPENANLVAQLSVVPLAIIIVRFIQLADLGKTEKPESLPFEDKFLFMAGLAWAILYFLGAYIF